MIAVLIVLSAIATHLALGAAYARSQALTCYRRTRDERVREFPMLARDAAWLERTVRREASELIWIRFWFWPIAAIYDHVGGHRYGGIPFGQRIAEAQAHADDLRAQADGYDALIRACDDPADRELMRQGQQALRQQAKDAAP